MDLKKLANNILFELSSTGKYSSLTAYDGFEEPNEWMEIDCLLSFDNDISSISDIETTLAVAILEMANLKLNEMTGCKADICEWLHKINIDDNNKLTWSFPIWYN